MNIKEEFAKEMLSIIRGAKSGVIDGIQQATNQIPDVVNQIMRYELIKQSFLAVCFVLLAALILCVSYMFLRLAKEARRTNEDEGKYKDMDASYNYTLCAACFSLLLCAPFVFLFDAIMNLIKITVAPKLFLIEYLHNIVS